MAKVKTKKSPPVKYYTFYQRPYKSEVLNMDVAADVVCIAAPSSKEANQVADNFGLLDLTEEGGFERFVPCAEKDGEPYPHFYGTPVEEMAHNSGDSENVICCTIIHYDETTKKMVLWSA